MISTYTEAIEVLEENERAYLYLAQRIKVMLEDSPSLDRDGLHCIHSIKLRKKQRKSILAKCQRKGNEKGIAIDSSNIFDVIEDYFGLRALHLHFDQLPLIHAFLIERSNAGEFAFGEQPLAYTWDPENVNLLKSLGFRVETKDSFYTSVHYIIKASNNSNVRCELQVRTLFEEVWGELDHWMNYPVKIDNLALKEQILVLSKLVSAGSRLAVAINRTYNNDRDKSTRVSGTESNKREQ